MSPRYRCLRSILCSSYYLVPLPIQKILRYRIIKNTPKLPLGSTNHNNLLVIFAGITLTLTKKWPQLFQVSIHVDLCHPMPKYSPLVFKKDSK